MLQVLLTIDTEVHSIDPGWREDHLSRDIRRDLYGEVGHKRVGLRYQLDTFERYGIKATFMVESLFSAAPEVGPCPLENEIRLIRAAGQEIQLHLHPEWIPHCPDLNVAYRSAYMYEYPLEEQARMVRLAVERLEACGAPRPIAFRAGGFAANEDTLLALSSCGIRYDSSFNAFYEKSKCKLPRLREFGRAVEINGVQEIPVAAFLDYPNHFRHAQICACSTGEIVHALEAAERAGWQFFVIVSHSFEMLSRRRHEVRAPRVREEVVRRFEELCRYLSKNADRFRMSGFGELAGPPSQGPSPRSRMLRGNPLHTVSRMMEQGVNRIHEKIA